MENKNIVKKLVTRKDIRERYTKEEAKDLFQWCVDKASKDNQYHSKEEIEEELNVIYNSSLEDLSKEDEEGILIFGEKCPWSHGIRPIS